MNFWLEALEVISIPIILIALLIGGFVWLPTLRQRHRSPTASHGTFQTDGWDLRVDGRVMATLIPISPPKDVHDPFLTYDVRIVAGHETEVKKLLFQSYFHSVDDARISYHSRSGDGVILKDSQVCQWQCDGENRLRMEVCPTDEQLVQAVEYLTDHPAPPQSPETPAPRAG